MSDFFTDPIFDWMLARGGIDLIDWKIKPRRILAVGIEIPGRLIEIHHVLGRLKKTTRHWLDIATIEKGEDTGKFANIEPSLNSGVTLTNYDWLIVVDDNVSFDENMLDRLITLSEWAGLSISQPAHKRFSFTSHEITLRKFRSFVRETHFVETGPITAFHRDVFSDVIPFPQSDDCLDLAWSELARKKSFKIGIVDAATVIRPSALANITKGGQRTLGFERIVPVDKLIRARMAYQKTNAIA